MSEKMQRLEHLMPQIYNRLLTLTCARLGANWDRAPDVLHTALVNVYKNVEKVRDIEKLEHWVLVIVKNEALQELRNLSKTKSHYFLVADTSEYSDSTKKNHPSAEDVAMARLEAQNLQRFLNTLPAQTRQIVALRGDGERFREVSDKLNLPIELVKARYYRTIQRYHELKESDIT